MTTPLLDPAATFPALKRFTIASECRFSNRLPCMLNETRSIEAWFVHSGLDADQLCKVLLELMVN